MRFRSIFSLTGPALLSSVLATASAASERAGIAIRLAANEADLPQGEFACYGGDGRIMIGLGFRVLPGRKYVTLDNTEGGTYVYDLGGATITFVGGFLEGFVGQDVANNKFHIHSASCGPFSTSVACAPAPPGSPVPFASAQSTSASPNPHPQPPTQSHALLS